MINDDRRGMASRRGSGLLFDNWSLASGALAIWIEFQQDHEQEIELGSSEWGWMTSRLTRKKLHFP